MTELFQADVNNRGVVFDPRTKLFAMLTLVIFVVGGQGVLPSLFLFLYAALPLLLLCISKRGKIAFGYGCVFMIACFFNTFLAGRFTGIGNMLLVMCCVFIIRIIPGLMMGAYIFSTTTVSEFICAMGKLGVTNKILVPMSVMFRFFPTVIEEFQAINQAMRMRDIRLGGKNVGKMVEYRLVPLMVCSVGIGNEIAEAALTRGLSADKRRTNICKIGFGLQDIFLILFLLIPYVYVIFRKVGIF